MHVLEKAGAVVLSKGDPTRIVLIYRANLDDWSFPKGHVEAGESFAITAVREAREETGLTVTIARELGTTQYTHPKGYQITVHMFLAQSQDDSALVAEHPGDRVEWVPVDQVSDRLSYKVDRDFFKFILEGLG